MAVNGNKHQRNAGKWENMEQVLIQAIGTDTIVPSAISIGWGCLYSTENSQVARDGQNS